MISPVEALSAFVTLDWFVVQVLAMVTVEIFVVVETSAWLADGRAQNALEWSANPSVYILPHFNFFHFVRVNQHLS